MDETAKMMPITEEGAPIKLLNLQCRQLPTALEFIVIENIFTDFVCKICSVGPMLVSKK